MKEKLQAKISHNEVLLEQYLNDFLETNSRKDRDKLIKTKAILGTYKECLKLLEK